MRLSYLACYEVPSQAAHSVHVMKMCNAFAELGHEVELVTAAGSTSLSVEEQHSVFSYYGLEPRFRIRAVPRSLSRGAEWVWAWLALKHAIEAEPDLVYTRSLPVAVLAARLGQSVILELHRISRNMAKSPRHVLGGSRRGWGASVSRAVRAMRSRREIAHGGLHFHDYLRFATSGAFMSASEALRHLSGTSNLQKVVVITHALKDDLVELFPELGDRVVVAPDAADPLVVDGVPMAVAGASSATLTIGYTGHLYPGKGMEVIAELAARCPWGMFHIVGGSEEDLDCWRKRLSGQSNVHFHGHVAASKVPEHLQSFDVCLLPNQPNVQASAGAATKKADIGRYTSPLKMFEYMAAGKPIVASDLPVLKEVLQHGQNALLCRHDNVEEWVAALHSLCVDRDLRRELGARAKKDFLTNYTWKKRASRVLSPRP